LIVTLTNLRLFSGMMTPEPLQWTPLLSVVRELCPLKTLPATLLSGNFYGVNYGH